MAFRDVRTAMSLSVCLLLVIGCGGTETMSDSGPEPGDGLPNDTVTLSPEDLARLPWYGVQRLPCDTVERYLNRSGIDTATTSTIELRLSGDSLVATPHVAVAGLGDSIRIQSDSLVWVAHFKEVSPFAAGARTVRGGGTRAATSRGMAASGSYELAVGSDSVTCGRYYYSIAAYHPDRPGRVHVADPPMWIMF